MEKIIILLTGNLYGLALLALPVYYTFKFARKFIKKLPDPLLPTIIIMLPVLLYGLSYDRILFDKKVKKFRDFKFVKTYELVYWGSALEPMTWFNEYIGSARIVLVDDIFKQGFYQNFYFNQNKDVMKDSIFGESFVEGHNPNCNTKKVNISPLVDGTFRISNKEFTMSEKDYKFYCIDDWTKERKAFADSKLKKLEK